MRRTIYRFKDFLKERFPWEVRKLSVHTALGCPHRDDSQCSGGCIYCYNPAFSNVIRDLPEVSIQIQKGIIRLRNSGYRGKFIAYFQTETNTHASIERLEADWRVLEDFPEDIVGISIGTRPDCLSEEILTLLSELGEKLMVWLELGLQSAHDRTLKLIHRGHDYPCFEQAVQRTKRYPNILVAAHIILGLPQEDFDDMLHTISEVNRLQIHGLKIHHLQVVRNTVLADWYAQGAVKVFDAQEYIDLLVGLLPHLSPDIVIHRLVGDIRDELLIAPRWSLAKVRMIQCIEDGLKKSNSYQGKLITSVSNESGKLNSQLPRNS